MVQALNSVASALIEALRVPDLISMGIVMKKLSFSLIFMRIFYEVCIVGRGYHIFNRLSKFGICVAMSSFEPTKPSFIFLFVTLTCDPAKSC